MASAQPPQAQQARQQTDFRRRTLLPSTLNNLRNATSSGLDLTSDEYLDKQEEELNRVVDQNVEQLVEGMKDLVALARIDPAHPPHPSASAHCAFTSSLKTQQMLRSAHALLGLANTLKLLHLFGDQQAGDEVRERRERELRDEIARLKQRASELAGEGADGLGAAAPL
ncbi:hypothetical protein JCM10296v2_007332 [Rhodotorula toruloides]